MWRSRQWRKLLNFIDHLPQDSFFHEAVANDEEHVRAIVRATRGQEKKDAAPRLAEWSLEASMLANLIDATRGVRDAVVAANTPKGRKAPMSEPYPRPKSAFDRVRYEERQRAHEALAARVLRRSASRR